MAIAAAVCSVCSLGHDDDVKICDVLVLAAYKLCDEGCKQRRYLSDGRFRWE